ncbi:MAG: hypothetical protein ACOH13_12645 [Flavobacteriales bacterium]
MSDEKSPVYLVQVEDVLKQEREKAVFSSKVLAWQFIKVQGLKARDVIEVADRTREGLVAQQPTRVYLKDDPVLGLMFDGVFDEDQAPEHAVTVWFDPLVPENEQGLGLYHSWIRSGQLAEPCLSFGCASCTCQLTRAQTPMLRKDREAEGVFHCFAESQEEASRTAHSMMKRHWEHLPVRAIAEGDDWHLIEQEAMTR